MTSQSYYFERITFDPEMMAGISCTCDNDVSDVIIRELNSRGYADEEILTLYPHLGPEDIQRALSDGANPAR